jgi:hypothetical protein
MPDNDASITRDRPMTAPPTRSRWSRFFFGRTTTVPEAWKGFVLGQVVVASVLWVAFGSDSATWWRVVVVVFALLAEPSYVWPVVSAYRYRR